MSSYRVRGDGLPRFGWRALLGGVLLVSYPVCAADIVVATRDPQASDANPGTNDKPLKTIYAAAARAQPGDHVIIHGGEYRETVIINRSGTADKPIIFEAAAGETPVIKGSDVVIGWVRKSANIWQAKLPKPSPGSVKQDDPSFWRAPDVRQVFIKDGVLREAVMLRPAATRKELVDGKFFHDSDSGELAIWVSPDFDPNKNVIEASVRGAWLYVIGDHIMVRGLQMRHTSSVPVTAASGCVLQGSYDKIEGCTLTWSEFCGLHFDGNFDSVIGCTLACHANSGLGGTGEGHLIKDCRVIYNNLDRFDYWWHCGGAKLIPAFSKSRILHNEFAYNTGPGLWLDDCCNVNLIEGNLCHDNEGAGILIEVSAANRLYNNICFNNRNPQQLEYLTPIKPNTLDLRHGFRPVRRPLAPQHRYFFGPGQGICVASSPFTKVYHNTCFGNEGEGIAVNGLLRRAPCFDMSSKDIMVLNNISAHNKGAQLLLATELKDSARLTSDHNVFFGPGAVLASPGYGAPIFDSLQAWTKRTGQDAHSEVIDPEIPSVKTGDFHPVPGSPIVGAAKPLRSVKLDYYGQPRPPDRVTPGACEPMTR